MGVGRIKQPKKWKPRDGVKTEQDGYQFDSKLELFFYNTCKKLNIKCQVKPKTYVIQQGFQFHKEKIRPITYTPDFYLPEYKAVIETKGFPNESWPLRKKLFLKYLSLQEDVLKFKELKNQKEVTEYLTSLIQPS